MNTFTECPQEMLLFQKICDYNSKWWGLENKNKYHIQTLSIPVNKNIYPPGHRMYIRRSEDVLDVFWTFYVRSVYLLCPRGCIKLFCLILKETGTRAFSSFIFRDIQKCHLALEDAQLYWPHWILYRDVIRTLSNI